MNHCSRPLGRIARQHHCLVLRAATALLLGGAAAISARAASVDPSVACTVNGLHSIHVFQGWPLMLEAALFHPQIFDTNAPPLNIAADAGRWSDLLTLQVQDASGTNVSWPFALLNSPGAAVTLDGQHMVQLMWVLSPQQTSLLVTGAYEITVTLDTTSVSNPAAWIGAITALPVELQLDTEPLPLTPAQTEAKYRTLAQYYSALGNSAEALNQINLLLQSDSNNIGGLSFKGALLAEAGRNRDALAAVDQALAQVHAQSTNAPEAPLELLHLRFDLMQALLPGRISSVAVSNESVFLQWNANPGHTYNLEHSPDLQTWMPLAPGLVATTNVVSWSTNGMQTREFFRIR